MAKIAGEIRTFIYNLQTELEKQYGIIESLSDEVESLENRAGDLKSNPGKISDGYHTFDELYYHRMLLFSIICNQNKDVAWKSWLHADGTTFEDYFIVGITTPEGDYSYHFNKVHWGMFNVKELPNAPEWDGHEPEDIKRLLSLL
ncbi:MAG: hypothetical protein PHH48_06490 [Eubacteriales bacterium]|nr:hypothetical protein [Eubacteriales bacterium]